MKRRLHPKFDLATRRLARLFVWSCVLVFGLIPAPSLPAVREPLPLGIAVATQVPNGRSAFDLSPDGQWLAYTWLTDESVQGGGLYTPSGVSFGEGHHRKQAAVANITTGQVIVLGKPSSFNWAPVWSPDGSRVAYYSDEGGQTGVWVWEKATGKTQRFAGVIARSFLGFETIRWSSDSQRLLCKILPEGVSVAQANGTNLGTEPQARFPETRPNEPAVIVFRSQGGGSQVAAPKIVAPDRPNPEWGDLAILNLLNHGVTRIARQVKPLWWAFSPDEKYVAYTSSLGEEANSQLSIQDIVLYELAAGQTRNLAQKIHLVYGIELNWSPGGTRLAYISNGAQSKGEIVTISVPDGVAKTMTGATLPSFSNGDGELAPLWDVAGRVLYARGNDGKLWRIDVDGMQGTAIGDIPGFRITGMVTRSGHPTLWTTGGGQTAWAIAHERRGRKAGIYRIDLTRGQTAPALVDERSYGTIFNLDASDATGEIAYVANDQQHLGDAWVFTTSSGRTRQVTHLNADLERYELGAARLIEWSGKDGKPLKGALLLPPGYETGRRLPLVVWAYGGVSGSADVNRFGLQGDLPAFDFHVLATRGYAVLSPDAPTRAGFPVEDLLNAVLPGIDAAIEQGYADPDRLAIMGQSYGSYSTLALISRTKRFKAAVITGAVVHPDLVADYLNIPPESADSTGGYYEHGQGNMHATPWDQPERYIANSPIFRFDQIETPLLIGQGGKDGNLIPSAATFAALTRLGKEVEYRIYKDEGHVLAGKANVVDFWQRRLDFLAEHLNLVLDVKGAILFDRGKAKSR